MSDNKCPKCGAVCVQNSAGRYRRFSCGAQDGAELGFKQGHACRIRELEAEVERLKRLVALKDEELLQISKIAA